MTSAGTSSRTPHGSMYTTGPSPCHRNAACRNHVTPSSPIRRPPSVASVASGLANRHGSARTARDAGRLSGLRPPAQAQPELPPAVPRVGDLAWWGLVPADRPVRADARPHGAGALGGGHDPPPGPDVLPRLAVRRGAGGPGGPATAHDRVRPRPGGPRPRFPRRPDGGSRLAGLRPAGRDRGVRGRVRAGLDGGDAEPGRRARPVGRERAVGAAVGPEAPGRGAPR